MLGCDFAGVEILLASSVFFFFARAPFIAASKCVSAPHRAGIQRTGYVWLAANVREKQLSTFGELPDFAPGPASIKFPGQTPSSDQHIEVAVLPGAGRAEGGRALEDE